MPIKSPAEEIRETLYALFAKWLAEVERMQAIVKKLLPALLFCLIASTVHSATVGNTTRLCWKHNSRDANGFRIEHSRDKGQTWALFTAVERNINCKTVNVPFSTEGCWRVVAWNLKGSSEPSNMVCTPGG